MMMMMMNATVITLLSKPWHTAAALATYSPLRTQKIRVLRTSST
jgi:hypothetical protein